VLRRASVARSNAGRCGPFERESADLLVDRMRVEYL